MDMTANQVDLLATKAIVRNTLAADMPEEELIKRIGFCCKWLDDPAETSSMKINARNRELNTGTTTVAWLNRQTTEVAEKKLWDLSMSNIAVTKRLVERVGGLAPELLSLIHI